MTSQGARDVTLINNTLARQGNQDITASFSYSTTSYNSWSHRPKPGIHSNWLASSCIAWSCAKLLTPCIFPVPLLWPLLLLHHLYLRHVCHVSLQVHLGKLCQGCQTQCSHQPGMVMKGQCPRDLLGLTKSSVAGQPGFRFPCIIITLFGKLRWDHHSLPFLQPH